MSTHAGIAVRDVQKRFGAVVALDGVSIDVEPGEVVALLGANGAGKSTLIRVIATTVIPDAGSVMVAGHDAATDDRAVRRACGISFADERSWYWRLTGRHNLEFFAAVLGFGRRESRRLSSRMLEEFGLAAAADRPFAGYSAGMRARLSLARALLADPQVLLLDEPTRSLDPAASAAFRRTIGNLAQQRGVAVLFATHDLHEAAELATRVVGMASGRVALRRGAGSTAAELEAAMLEAQA